MARAAAPEFIGATTTDAPRSIATSRTFADRIYRAIALGSGFFVLVLLMLIGLLLLTRAWPALKYAGISFLTTSVWKPTSTGGEFGIAAILYWTVVISMISLVLALPLALGAALYVTEYAPLKLRKSLIALVDLLAAIPSLTYGMWGLFFLQPHITPLARWIADTLGFIPIFKADTERLTSSAFIAGIVVGLMIVPIITSVVREVFSQAPPGEKEGAIALGATRWAMIRTVVLPFGKGGIIGGSMLGLGRALGETIAVALIISPIFSINLRILETGANSVASLIALRFGEASNLSLSALMAAGLALFLLTLAVNTSASVVVAKSRSGKGVEISSASLPAPAGKVSFKTTDLLVALGCLASSGAIVWLLYYRLTTFTGTVGFIATWVVTFLVVYWLAIRDLQGSLAATDRIASILIAGLALSLLIPLLLIIGFVVIKGVHTLTPAFFTQSLEGVGPLDPPEKGGAAHAIIGTLEQIGLAVVLSVPLGFATAVFLNEVGGPLRRPVRIFVNAMSGVPSIVAGLFIYGVLIIEFKQAFSGLAAGLALTLLMLPTVTRTAEEVLRLVPAGLREASLALGAQEWSTVWRVVLPTARAGLVTAAILGVARAVGETAPLILTAFGTNNTNLNLFKNPQSALPLFTYSLLASPIPSDQDRA